MNKPVETPSGAVSELASRTHILGTVLEPLSRAPGVYVSAEMKNLEHPGVRIFANVTSVGASGAVAVKIQVKDPLSGNWIDLAGANTAGVVAAGLAMFTVYPGLSPAANDKVDGHLGITWRVAATVGVNAVTCSVAAEYLG